MIKVLIDGGCNDDLGKANKIGLTPYDYGQPKLRLFLYQYLPKPMQEALKATRKTTTKVTDNVAKVAQ